MSTRRLLEKYGVVQVLKTKKVEIVVSDCQKEVASSPLHVDPFKLVLPKRGRDKSCIKRLIDKDKATVSGNIFFNRNGNKRRVIKRPMVKDYIFFSSFSISKGNIQNHRLCSQVDLRSLSSLSNDGDDANQKIEDSSETNHLWSFRASLANLSCICTSYSKNNFQQFKLIAQ